MDFPLNFIKAGDKFTTVDEHVPAPFFRRTFTAEKEMDSAELIITGLGYYELFVNGKKITKGPLAPYRSNIDDYIYYDRYDVTSQLSGGKNVIGIMLGNGIRNAPGAYIWEFEKARFRGAPITAFSLSVRYKDGSEETVVSDTDTLTAPSPVIFDELHFGEYYDARLEIPGWNLPDFDDSGWSRAVPAEPPRGEARLCGADPITVRSVIKPVSVTKYTDDSYIYDFGVNTAGLCRLRINGTEGQKVLMRYFETFVDGEPYFRNNRFDPDDRFQEDEYYCSGKGTEEYTPHFTYHGFRYVLVSGITADQATSQLLTYLEMSSDIKQAGGFKCSDETVNKIQEATVRSDTSNFFYFPTDCPQREKNGWTADASLSAEQVLLNLAPEKSYKEWMRNIYKALNDKGQLPGIVPTAGWGYHWGNGPAWDNVIVYIPYYTYKYCGDRQILEELAVPLMRYLNYLFTRLDDKGLIAIGLGDWCQVGLIEDQFKTPLVVTDTILTCDIAEKAAFIYGELGMEPQKQFALSLAEKTRTAFRENLINKDLLTVEAGTQTGQAMALYYGMFTEEEKARALDVLVGYIHEADDHFDTGVLGGKVIYRVLAENGYADLAYKMITRPDFPSYGNWIARGATTLWEAFYPENGRILSLNHHFWGDVSAWFYIYLAGMKINPSCKDITEVDIKPCFVEALSEVSAYHDMPDGKISVSWNRNGGKITLAIKAADKLHGKIGLPAGYAFEDGDTEKELKSGNYSVIRK